MTESPQTPQPDDGNVPPRAESLLPPGVDRKALVRASAITTLVMILVAGVILLLTRRTYWEIFEGGMPLSTQFAGGLAIGIWIAVIVTVAGGLLPPLRGFQDQVNATFRHIRPKNADMIAVSAGAGIGEEILFRAAIQPILGIWITSALFALAHGTLTKLTWGRVAYAAALFIGGLILGWIFDTMGLLAAILAHASYDYTALWISNRVAMKYKEG